jgi:uncharacterized protein YndB with AHSA1/START domain
MSATTQPDQPGSRRANRTTIAADPALPTITITREFDAPIDLVFRAHAEADLLEQWLGPRDQTLRVDHYDFRTGGSWRYGTADGAVHFYGSFHEVRAPERVVQTFTFDGAPDSVSLETLTLEDLEDGRTRLTGLGVVESLQVRDAILASGMEKGVVEGYEQLDGLLVTLA